ncbi:MAG: AAA family ATPase [Promethearchaeota archaeon]
MKRYCLVGIKGVGKTTLLRSVLPLPNIEYYTGSQILKKLVGKDFYKFDYFSNERKEYFRKKAIQFLWDRQSQNGKDILIDGHVTLFNPKTEKIERIFTESDCEFYTDLILLEAPINLVLIRRINDLKKRITNRDYIKQELIAERNEVNRLKKEFGMVVHYIYDDDETENTRNSLISIILEGSK